MPPVVYTWSRANRVSLLQGLVDTDGTVDRKQGSITFSSSSKKLIGGVIRLVRSLGGKAQCQKTKKTERQDHYRISIILPNRREAVSLPRKLSLVKDYTSHNPEHLQIEAVESVGVKECQCIAVTHPRRLFLIEDYVPTHNSIFSLYIALWNWHALQHNVLFVSMEMPTLQVAQRASAMYAGTGLTQLQIGGYSKDTFEVFSTRMSKAKEEPAKLYVVDGNLAATVEDIYTLGAQLGCTVVFIDGAYLLRHKDKRLGRYEKVHDNVEMIKRYSGELEVPTIASWQFNREAAKLDQKKGQRPGVEHIGSSDAIGQVSSIVCGLAQDEGVETMQSRLIQLLKGRNGEVGEFRVNWNFNAMDFSQVQEVETVAQPEYEYL